MKIKAELTAKGVSVTGMIAIPERSILKPVNLLVDTGNDITLLNEVDALKIGIDYRTLPRAKKPSLSIGGTFENYVLENIILILELEDKGGRDFEMEFIHVSRFPVRTGQRGKTDKDRLKAIPNLLGRDFLTKYEMKLFADFGEYKAHLECE